VNAEKRLKVGFQVQMRTMCSREKNLLIVFIVILPQLENQLWLRIYLANKTSKNTNVEKKIKKQLLELRRYIEKNCKNVGYNFPREARSIHYDKKASKGIYGMATPEETLELLEEGIDVATIPWQNKSEN